MRISHLLQLVVLVSSLSYESYASNPKDGVAPIRVNTLVNRGDLDSGIISLIDELRKLKPLSVSELDTATESTPNLLEVRNLIREYCFGDVSASACSTGEVHDLKDVLSNELMQLRLSSSADPVSSKLERYLSTGIELLEAIIVRRSMLQRSNNLRVRVDRITPSTPRSSIMRQVLDSCFRAMESREGTDVDFDKLKEMIKNCTPASPVHVSYSPVSSKEAENVPAVHPVVTALRDGSHEIAKYVAWIDKSVVQVERYKRELEKVIKALSGDDPLELDNMTLMEQHNVSLCKGLKEIVSLCVDLLASVIADKRVDLPFLDSLVNALKEFPVDETENSDLKSLIDHSVNQLIAVSKLHDRLNDLRLKIVSKITETRAFMTQYQDEIDANEFAQEIKEFEIVVSEISQIIA